MGEKLGRNTNGNVRNYVDGIEYNGNTIDIIHTEEGIARNNGGNYSYEYNLTDYLGNVRASFYRNPTSGALEVLQRDDYYAFGLRRQGSVVASNDNKYLYNGKELQEDLGQYDYGARFYDPVIGRWNAVDPYAHLYDDSSPYNYGMNNPILNIDPNGMWTQTLNGWSSDNEREAQDFFKALRMASSNGGKLNIKTVMGKITKPLE